MPQWLSFPVKNRKDFDNLYSIIGANSHVLSISEQNWIDAGEERVVQREKQKNFRLIDSIILKIRSYWGKVYVLGVFVKATR